MHIFRSAVYILAEYREAYLDALATTLQLCGVAWVTGLFVGTSVLVFGEVIGRALEKPLSLVARMVEAIPFLVGLFWLHYPLQKSLGVVIDPFFTTALLLSLYNSSIVYSILRDGVDRTPVEYLEVARVFRIKRRRFLLAAKLPLAVRRSLGSLLSAQILVVQLSIFGGLISANELFRISQRVNAIEYDPISIYSILGCFFLLICLPGILLSRRLSSRMEHF